MTIINTADALYLGVNVVDAVYAGSQQVWPASSSPESIEGCVLAFTSDDLGTGSLTSWPDRSPEGNDIVPISGTPVSSGDFVTFAPYALGGTTDNVNVTGNAPRHIFARVRTRNIGGAFMGYGSANGSQLFDLWNYNPGALIWHGHGGGYDTLSGAPAFTPDVWHTIEVSYNSPVMSVHVDENSTSVVVPILNTQPSPFWFGQGRYSPGGDFDMSHFYFYDRVLDTEERSIVLEGMTV